MPNMVLVAVYQQVCYSHKLLIHVPLFYLLVLLSPDAQRNAKRSVHPQ